MRRLIYVGIILFLVSCRLLINKSQHDLIRQVYQNQQLYYDGHLSHQVDYNSIISFARKGRGALYKKEGLQPDLLKNFIILEGFSSGWGDYRGLLITDSENYFYTNNRSGKWTFKSINIDNDIEKETGIKKGLIDKVRLWDTMYINTQKKQFGALVSDGFVFMATRVRYENGNSSKMETIAFDEFVP